MEQDVIIIGAGPAGLMAAYELTKIGRRVLLLEARNRIGGRIHTLPNGVEHGAEFIHGELPITISLLKQAGLNYIPVSGTWVQQKGGTESAAFENSSWPLLMSRLKDLKEDICLQDFLTKYFPGDNYAALKDQAISYAEGYDTADVSRASAMALYEEWSVEGEDQYRITGGYGSLLNYLVSEIVQKGGRLRYAQPVTAVAADASGVSVTTTDGNLRAEKVIVAAPLGVLQKEKGIALSGKNAPEYIDALKSLGFGDVIKFVLRFRECFWESAYPGLGFLISGAQIPTWWTQMPDRSPVLTGWLGGRNAISQSLLTESQLLDIAINSLANIFSLKRDNLSRMLTGYDIANWSADPYTLGSYAYATVGYRESQFLLSKPMAGHVYFAGEYMYDGPAMGTVEAALWSGQQTAFLL